MDDLEIQERFGLEAMQNARLLRLIEESYLQGAVFDQPKLGMVTNITAKSIRSRISPYLQKGIRLPLLGQKREYRLNRIFPSTCAFEELISGKSNAEVMSEFLYTENQWESTKIDFVRTINTAKCGDKMEQSDMHPEIAAEYTSPAEKVSTKHLSKLRQEFMASSPLLQDDLAFNLLIVLQDVHNFSPTEARAYLRMLQKHAEKAAAILGHTSAQSTKQYVWSIGHRLTQDTRMQKPVKELVSPVPAVNDA